MLLKSSNLGVYDEESTFIPELLDELKPPLLIKRALTP